MAKHPELKDKKYIRGTAAPFEGSGSGSAGKRRAHAHQQHWHRPEKTPEVDVTLEVVLEHPASREDLRPFEEGGLVEGVGSC